jgi:site-specific recombinase XerD
VIDSRSTARPADSEAALARYLDALVEGGYPDRVVALEQRRLALLAEWLAPAGLLEANRNGVESFLESQQLSDVSRTRYVSTLRGFYRWAVLAGLSPSDPTAGLLDTR